MANNPENLKIQLSEWRRKFDSLDAGYDKIRVRSISLLAVQFGFSSFVLLSLSRITNFDLHVIVFFIFGSLLLLVSIILCVVNYVSKAWHSPMYKLEIEKMNNAKNLAGVYKVLIDDYDEAYHLNLKVHEPSARNLNIAVYLFAASAIIILTLMLT